MNSFDAVVVQADRIEHARRSSRRFAAGGFRPAGSAVIVLGRMPPSRRKIHQSGHFPRVSKRARGHGDRVGQPQPA